MNAAVLLICFLLFAPSLFFNLPLSYGTDIRTQGFPFFHEFSKLIHQFIETKQFPFYSWSMFLGNNFWASKSFYIMGDPYAYLGLLYKGNFFDMERNLSLIKFLVAANGFYFLLTEMGSRPFTKLLLSVIYTFSGWPVFFSGQSVFLSFYSFVPYYLWGIERYLRNQKWLLFAFNCGLIFAVNYYFFYSLSLLTVLYFTWRYYLLEKDPKQFWKSAFRLVGYDLLGSCLSAAFWLPSLIYITGSGRFGNKTGLLYDPAVYLHMLYSWFVPNHLYIYRNNIFDTNFHFTRELCLSSSVITTALIPQYFRMAGRKEKKFTIMMLGALTAVLAIPAVSSAFQGFADASFRWTYFFVTVVLLISARVLDHPEEVGKGLLRKTVLVMAAVMILSFLMAAGLKNEPLALYRKQLLITVLCAGFTVLIGMTWNRLNRLLLAVLVIAELAIPGFYTYYDDTRGQKENETYDYLDRLTHVLETYPKELQQTLCSLDPDASTQFYRMYIPLNEVYWDYTNNMSVFYDIQGLMTYDSSFAPSFLDLYQMVPEVNQYESDWIFNIENPDLMDFLNVRYAAVPAGMEMNSGRWELLQSGYLDTLDLYRNRNYRPLLTAYEKLQTKAEYLSHPDPTLFTETVIVNPDLADPEKISSHLSPAEITGETTEHYGNYLSITYTSDQEGYGVCTIPYDKGWKLLDEAGNAVSFDCVSGGFIGLPVFEGTHTIRMYFMPQGFKEGVMLCAAGVVGIVLCLFLGNRRKKA